MTPHRALGLDPPMPPDRAVPITGSPARESSPCYRRTLGTALGGHCQGPLIQPGEHLPVSCLGAATCKDCGSIARHRGHLPPRARTQLPTTSRQGARRSRLSCTRRERGDRAQVLLRAWRPDWRFRPERVSRDRRSPPAPPHYRSSERQGEGLRIDDAETPRPL